LICETEMEKVLIGTNPGFFSVGLGAESWMGFDAAVRCHPNTDLVVLEAPPGPDLDFQQRTL
jgi:hypothetical protein